MKKMLLILICTVALNLSSARGAPVPVEAFDDILFWAGSGTNQSGLVLQFPTTIVAGTAVQTVEPTSIAWGFRWNGSATMADMLFSLAGTIQGEGAPAPAAGADSRLTIDVTNFGQWGWGINEITYDQRGLGSGWSDEARTISTNPLTYNPYPAQYNLAAAQGAWTEEAFTANPAGISFLGLTDGGWYGVLEADGSGSGPPATMQFSQPVSAVPEPSTWVLLAGAAGVAGCGGVMRRRRVR